MAGQGTGQPNWFLCPVNRRANNDAYYAGRNYPVKHRVELTGRTRPNHSRKIGGRTSPVVREYRCLTCGHVGWSNHIELERMEARSVATGGTRFGDIIGDDEATEVGEEFDLP